MRLVPAIVVIAAIASAPALVRAERMQLTDIVQTDCVMFAPRVSADGAKVTFESTCNLTGENTDGNREIFQVDDAGTVIQLTDTTGCANAGPASSTTATAVAFDSDCDFGNNSDASVEIFLWKPSGIVQITNASFCTSAAPSLNGAGTRIAFHSDCDLVAGSNVDRSTEIFRATDAAVVTQLTDDETGAGCGSLNASIASTADTVTYESDCDPNGTNIDFVNEIFQVTTPGTVTQLTASAEDTCGSATPASNRDGSVVAFTSDCDYAGQNGDGSVEIFTVATGGTVDQLSDDDGTPACESSLPAISEDGAAVAFMSFCDLAALNTDRSFEIFRSRGGPVEQVSRAQSCSSVAPSLRSSGNLLVWVSDCNLTAENADGSDEIFVDVSSCACGAPATRYESGTEPQAVDALFALRAAVRLQICALCDCDVNADEQTTAADALRILQRAVGQNVALVCA